LSPFVANAHAVGSTLFDVLVLNFEWAAHLSRAGDARGKESAQVSRGAKTGKTCALLDLQKATRISAVEK